ncbi:MAG TPA: hypothetical protein VFG84_07790 [Gemmatimonadaceae bacterium]|nr:hypothetical protein [Gemmatimonadaceae bacterium]
MLLSRVVSWSTPSIHDTLREGARLGVALAVITWLWVAAVDIIAGQPFHTFAALGGVIPFTVGHLLLNILLGVVLVSVVHSAAQAPSVILGMIFCGIIFEVGIAMTTNLLSQYIGNIVWLGLFGGSLLSTAAAIALLAHGHPLLDYLHRAEEEK